MPEKFRPVTNTPPIGLAGKMKFFGRMFLDFQVLTVYKDLKRYLPYFRGNVLDVGCGQSPYRHLLAKNTIYFGIDIFAADKQFDYRNSEMTPFNGVDIPFEDKMFDGVICTEVLEHVEHFQKLVDEMYRVMKPGSVVIVTVPWSARFHYIPYDFYRYTPSALKIMFNKFSKIEVVNRGSDISNIGNKLVVMWFRNIFPVRKWEFIFAPFWILALPILGAVALVSHISIILRLGSTDDPLGYTVIATK